MKNSDRQIHSLQYVRRDELDKLAPFDRSDLPLLMNLRRQIAEAGCLDRFGVSLRTFQRGIGAGETTLEETDEQTRTSFTEVLPIASERLTGSRPTNWSFSQSSEVSAGNCPGYCDYKDWRHTNRHTGRFHAYSDHAFKPEAEFGAVVLQEWCAPGNASLLDSIDDVPMTTEADLNLLARLRSTILSDGQEARVCIILLHKHFDVGADELLVERCLTEPRLSIVKAVTATSLQGDVVPSVLRFAA